jgi:hypothetical protein
MATNLETFPRNIYVGANSPNSCSFQNQSIASRTISGVTWQVCGFWALDTATGKLAIGVRQLPWGAWTIYKYNGVGGFTDISLSADDAHNVVCVEIDADGYVHVAYDHHTSALHYRRSDAPLASWTGALTAELSMLGTNETAVTYPCFFRDPQGVLRFMFRQQNAAGSGADYYFYQYTEGTTSWAACSGTGTAGKLIENTGSGATAIFPYPFLIPCYSSDWDGAGTGWMHLSWTPRKETGGTLGENIYHMKWNGSAWKKLDGSAQTIPANVGNAENVHTTTTSDNLLNTSYMCLDANDRPHITVIKDVTGVSQLHDLYWDGSAWQLQQLTSYAGTSASTNWGRPLIVNDAATNACYILFSHANNETGVMVQLASNPGDFTTWTKTTFYNAQIGMHEPTIDWNLWRTEKEICMWVVRGRDISSGLETPRIVQRGLKSVSVAFTPTRKHALTIDHTKVGTGGVTGYTAVLTRANFDNEVCDPSGTNRAQKDGGDLRFYSDQGFSTQIACQIVTFGYDSSSGAGDAVVEVRVGPITLSDSADTVIYVGYHSASNQRQPFVDETYGARAAHDANWLFNVPFSRSQSNAYALGDSYFNASVGFTSYATAKLGNGVDFNGASAFAIPGQTLGIGSAFSMAAWLSVDTTLTEIGMIFGADDNSTNRGLFFRVESATGKPTLIRFDSSNNVTTNITGTSDLRNAGFKRVVGEWNNSAGANVRVNGTSEASDVNTTAQHDDASLVWRIGLRQKASGSPSYDLLLKAIMDQFEVHTTKRGAAWWTTDYNNQNSPSTFAAAGTPSAAGLYPPWWIQNVNEIVGANQS